VTDGEVGSLHLHSPCAARVEFAELETVRMLPPRRKRSGYIYLQLTRTPSWSMKLGTSVEEGHLRLCPLYRIPVSSFLDQLSFN
jgi:hypothetical protein